MFQAQKAWNSHPEPREYGDCDFTLSRWEGGERYPHLQGVRIVGHSDGHEYLYLWGVKDGCEVFHIRIWEPGQDVLGNEIDPLKYLDGRDKGYIISMVKGMVIQAGLKTRYQRYPGCSWTLRGLPDVRMDPAFNLRFALNGRGSNS